MLRPWRYPEVRRRIAPFVPKLDPPGIALRFVHLYSILLSFMVGGWIQNLWKTTDGGKQTAVLPDMFGIMQILVLAPFLFMFRGYYCQASGVRFIMHFRWFWVISSVLLLIGECGGLAALMVRMNAENVIGVGIVTFFCWLSLRALRQSWSYIGSGPEDDEGIPLRA